MKLKAALLLVLGCAAVSACGLQPMYAGGSNGTIARGLANVDVAPIEGRAGWLMRNALRDKLAPGGVDQGGARYVLTVKLDEQLTGLGLLSDVEVLAAEAQCFYRKALYLEPQHSEALAHLAALLAAQGDAAGAQRLQERAARHERSVHSERKQ